MCWRSRPSERRVVVGPREALAETRVRLTELNWLARDPPAAAGMALAARLRSAQPPVAATLYPGAAPGAAELVFAEPTQAWRPARPRFFMMASGCSAAAGSGGRADPGGLTPA